MYLNLILVQANGSIEGLSRIMKKDLKLKTSISFSVSWENGLY